jgi:ABC-type spermidine/putrescine transport system permease subunit I
MTYLCQYKDIFGEPRKGIHSYRLFNLALVDTLATLILAYILKYFGFKATRTKIFVILMIMSVFIHKLFCVETTLTNVF